MKNILLTSLMFLFTTSVWAQRFSSTLTMHDGSVKEGVVSLPKNNAKTVTFALNDGKTIRIPSADIAVMSVTNRSGAVGELEYVPVATPRSSLSGARDKIQGYMWLFVETRGYVTLYSTHSSSYWVGRELPEFRHFCRREGEKLAALVATSSPSPTSFGHNKNFRRYASVYFADDQVIVDQINDGTFTNKNLVQMVEEYNNRRSKD